MSDDGSEGRGLVAVESEYNDPDTESKSLESQKTVTEVVFHLLKSSLGIIPVETKENEVKALAASKYTSDGKLIKTKQTEEGEDETETGFRDDSSSLFIADEGLSWSDEAVILRSLVLQKKLKKADYNFFYGFFKSLRLIDMRITDIDKDARMFANLQELSLTANYITKVQYLPPSVEILNIYGNRFPKGLLHLGIGHNRLTGLSTIPSLHSLLSVDLSFNNLYDLPGTLQQLATLPRLKQLTLLGNPMCLVRNYRATVLNALPKLLVFDDAKVTEEERSLLAAHVQKMESSTQKEPSISFTIDGFERIKGLRPESRGTNVTEDDGAYLNISSVSYCLNLEFEILGVKYKSDPFLGLPVSVPDCQRVAPIEITPDLGDSLKNFKFDLQLTKFKKPIPLGDVLAKFKAKNREKLATSMMANTGKVTGNRRMRNTLIAAKEEILLKNRKHAVSAKISEELKAACKEEQIQSIEKVAEVMVDVSLLLTDIKSLEKDLTFSFDDTLSIENRLILEEGGERIHLRVKMETNPETV